MGAKILIVDDEAPFRVGIRCYLADEGYAVVEADCGSSAIQTVEAERPDLVLLDLRMPKMSGLDVLQAMRATSANLPVVMISGAGEISDVVESMRLGAWDYLVKPIVDLRILGQVVHQTLDRLRLLLENQAYRTHLEAMISERTAELAASNTALKRKTIALEEVLSTYRAESTRRTARVIERIDQFVRPLLESGGEVRQELLSQFEAALSQATSESLDQMAQKLAVLTPAELRVCEMIHRGMGSKEIATAAGITPDTVETHRRNIRRKLRINNETVNLSTFLRQLLEGGTS
jgi:DNA-binding NarL/FixJ family response regulator